MQKIVDEPLPIDIFATSTDPGQSTMGLFGQFVFSQVLIDCILRLKPSAADRTELISYCKREYNGNRRELANIQQFERDYDSSKALRWYTKDTFFYKTLNASLRRQNVHMIFLFREFISDIQRLLKRHQSAKPLKVYRGQMMTTEELDRLRQSVGKLISINSFFSTSLDASTVFSFLKTGGSLEPVLLEISADPQKVTTKPFADISQHSDYFTEAEVLFMIGSIFHVDSVDRNNKKLWTLRLTLSNDDEHDLKQVLLYMKGQVGTGDTNLRTLGKVLWKMGKFDLAEQYFLRFLKELKPDDPLARGLYEDLGELAALKGDYDASVEWHKKSLAHENSKDVNDTRQMESLPNSTGKLLGLRHSIQRPEILSQ